MQGMNIFAFVAYSSILGLLPLFLSHPFLKRMTVVKNFIFIGINLSSPTLLSAMSNLDTAITFILAVIFRLFFRLSFSYNEIRSSNFKCLEKDGEGKYGSFRSQIKILGTIFSVVGALVMSFYKGPALWDTMPLNALNSIALPQLFQPAAGNWVLGGLCFAVVSLSGASSNILQASVLKENQSEITVVLYSHLFGTIQCAVFSLIAVRDLSAWKLRPDIELAAILFLAIGGSVASCISAWCIAKKGPVFVALFSPMGVVIAAIMSVIFLGDILHVGSVVGAIIIITGFYAVIWAKSKDRKY